MKIKNNVTPAPFVTFVDLIGLLSMDNEGDKRVTKVTHVSPKCHLGKHNWLTDKSLRSSGKIYVLPLCNPSGETIYMPALIIKY
ncbi:hypothetical protein SAMN05444362_101222 [Dysgonomonas macrotermitis]|uniref:Uncharacterized protein n=1 Tax=Dysgonomonas macrotermitis TaxID=1346286 RepID=A0A1M4T306_9BACT|nr:hypothetical protein SAMN05444362_101222 [Dysgonomonas macrotermitis]